MSKHVAIIGAGPAGLMAAEVLSSYGVNVTIYEAMPAPGRKFLRAGVGGLNLTKNQPLEDFIASYTTGAEWLRPHLQNFGPKHVRAWADNLGADTFVGSSGKVFPKAMKAAPLLRAWLQRLSNQNVSLQTRHQWIGWNQAKELVFETPNDIVTAQTDATLLALGGASWPELGSRGNWTHYLESRGVEVTPWQPSNCGFHVDWSKYLSDKFAGQHLPKIALSHGDKSLNSTATITKYGLEGHGIYALSSVLRDSIAQYGNATLIMDLAPDRSQTDLLKALSRPRGTKSFSTHLKRTIRFDGIRAALLREICPNIADLSAKEIADTIKALPIVCTATRPLSEAISSAGGISLNSLDNNLMLKDCPSIFCAGEMLDWDAPTGGYLLTACLALGKSAGENLHRFLNV